MPIWYLHSIDANNDYELDLLGDVVVSVVVAVVGVVGAVGAVTKILDYMSKEDWNRRQNEDSKLLNQPQSGQDSVHFVIAALSEPNCREKWFIIIRNYQ